MPKQPYIIGITGGSASGKSSFARDLKSMFSDAEMTVLCEDNYYLPLDKIAADANGVQNFDTPDAIDHNMYTDHVRKLKAGTAVQKEENIFHAAGTPKLLTYYPTPLVVVEGIFAIHFDEVKDLIDLKLYIEADPTARYNRRVNRDLTERGLDLADVEYRWQNHIVPHFEENHEEYKACADIIVLNNTNYQQGLQVITAFLKNILFTRSAGQ